ncbi:MAG: acetate--CoA ligase family protein [Rhodobiaceae bacterium]|nr:acetate--CoA ligase family protein [Rhodobiaceae bacterium]MCC0042018.1 acetate--CoA ligase family protein [Rhodobiaceae bacterium]
MQPLDRLLRPRSIAVIGGGAWCANVIRECRRIGFAGDVWPVHPARSEIAGVPAYPSVAALPQAPDAAFIGVNREATVAMVGELAGHGAGGAVCFASGFREASAELGDAGSLQDALVAAAGDMRILGPNCYGLLNLLDGVALWPDQHGAVRVERGVAIITQSSNIAINLTMQQRALPLAYVVTAGNQAQTGLAEIGAALLADPRVTALGLHIEGIGDIRGFEAMAAAARHARKPVVALKIGASQAARAATVSHTASLAGSDAGAGALLERLGIARVRSLPVLLETLKLLHVTGPLTSGRIASMSCSGGEASLMADSGVGIGVEFPPLNVAQRRDLAAALGPKVALANPLDYHTYIWNDRQALARCFSAMMDESLALGCVVLDFPRADRCAATEWALVIDAVADARQARGVPMALLATLPETMPESVATDAIARGIAPLCGIDEALAAIAAAASLGRDRPPPDPVLLPATGDGVETLGEAEAKAALARHGLRVPRGRAVDSPQQAGEVAVEIGFPVALKGMGFAHKSEAGAVALRLADAEAVRAAAAAMPATRFLVEEMVADANVELLVGIVRDPAHGYVVTIATGGTLTEILKDSVSLLLPVRPDDIRAVLKRLRVWSLLAGYRGAAPADIDALVAAVMAIASYVEATPQAVEVEVNPLLCGPRGAIAADALIRLGEQT